MEFEELKKIWDEQKQKTMYTIDEQGLHNIVSRKKIGAIKKAKFMEYFLIGANLIAGSTIIIAHILKSNQNYFTFSVGIIMVFTAAILLYFRSLRLSEKDKYDRSINGDLEHALSDAKYVVRMSRTMQYYFILIALLTLVAKGMENIAFSLGLAIFFIITLYASTWEHKFYVKKLRELVELKNLLESEEP